MLGLGELIFVLVIVVQGVAAIAAAAQKKKKRAAARAQEIAAEEGRPGSSQASPALTRQKDEETRLDRVRALEERQARKALKQQKREAQLKQLRGVMESSTAKSMTEAVSMLAGLSPATKDSGNARSDQASASTGQASAGPAGLPAGRGIPPMGSSATITRRPPLAPPAPGQIAADEASFAAFEKKVRKPKASPFGVAGSGPSIVGGPSAVGSTRRGLSLRGTLRNRQALRQAFVLKTLLEPPVALRDEAETAG